MVVFGSQAMRAYREYFKRMKTESDAHEAPAFKDVVEGKDVE
jgi:hypothetical protein